MPRAPDITPEEVKGRLAAGERLVVLDVRDLDEVEAWPFPGSVHIPLGEVLQDRLGALPRGGEVVTMCAHGNRSAEAAEASGTPAISITRWGGWPPCRRIS